MYLFNYCVTLYFSTLVLRLSVIVSAKVGHEMISICSFLYKRVV